MDSIGQLSSSLPPDFESKQLQASFRQAALSITDLFKQGKRASAKAYISGQRQALHEVLEYLQALLDQPAASTSSAAAPLAGTGPVDVGRLINFICARQEALKAEEESHDDDDAAAPPPPAAPPVRRAASAAPAPASPLRPSVSFQRTASSGGLPPRPASAAASTSARHHHPHDHATSSAPASPPSSAFSPPYARSTSSHFASTSHLHSSAPSTSARFTAASGPTSSTPASTSANLTFTAPPSPSPLTPHSHAPAFVTGPASPLSRAPGRSLRPRPGARDRAAGKPAATAAGSAAAAGAAGGDDMGEEYEVELGMKRRWPGGSAGGGGGGGAAPGDGEVVELAPPGEGLEQGMDVEGMGMEGWDGIGERPFKRVTRRAAAADGAAGGAGEGGAGEPHR
ncbi:hypothetical protein JCM8208_002767 [Rhodotorula glutinis]